MNIKLNFNNNSKTVNWNNNNNNNQTITADIDKWPIVPDENRGYYRIVKGSQVNAYPIAKPTHFLKIALIVESPHKDEFDQIFNPLCPLNGRSGQKFSNHIVSNLRNWFNNALINNGTYNFEIRIINPIQYQASLFHFLNGKIPYNTYGFFSYNSIDQTLRNDVWRFLYETCELELDFIKRIQTYSPNYIINCCTGKSLYRQFNINTIRKIRSNNKNLKALTRESLRINNLISSRTYLEYKHPIRWQ